MQNTALNQNPYGVSDSVIRSERSIEYQAFAKVTAALTNAARGSADYGATATAIYENRRLWNILASDVAEDENKLPLELRASIFSISQFVMRHSAQVLQDDASIETLIEINKSIMRGLGKG